MYLSKRREALVIEFLTHLDNFFFLKVFSFSFFFRTVFINIFSARMHVTSHMQSLIAP